MKGLQFDPGKHAFTYLGRPVPSVTAILKDGGWVKGEWYTEEARNRGASFHEASALLDAGRLDWDTVSPAVAIRLMVYEEAKAQLGLRRFRGIERIVSKGDMWAGILDRLVVWKGCTVPLELKTGQPEGWHKLQVCGYGATFPKRPAFLLLLYVGQRDYKLVELTPKQAERYYLAWHQIVSLYHFRKEVM